jgi:hypothetical protein
MTRIKFLFAALVVAAIVAVTPAAHAVTSPCTANTAISCHVVGSGSSAQFLTAALAADSFAQTQATSEGNCPYHWTAKNAANVIDNRDGSAIQPELGSVFIVWTASCTNSNSNVLDIWTDIQVDSTVGVREFMAQEATGSGAQVQIIPGASGALVPCSAPPTSCLWPDNTADVASITASSTVAVALGTSATGGQHLNVGLTDIRPEDALYATNRAYATLNTTNWAGLGYKNVTNIGWPIYTNQGTNTKAVPTAFALSGNDPISHIAVRSYETVPLGAAPIVFAFNNTGNGGVFDPTVANLITGVGVTGAASKKLAHLFDGTTACDTHSAAFGGNDDGLGNPISLVLREPLSGTMNTTEFTVFRSFGNTTDSQEKGVITPVQTTGPYNPLDLGCPTHGHRVRAIGTGEVINAIAENPAQPDPSSLGYFFWGFANAFKISGTNVNYLTLSETATSARIDPIGLATTNQKLSACGSGTTACGESLWTGNSFPSLRNGTYPAWSLLRWVVDPSTDSDTFGPKALANAAQGFVVTSFADFVPLDTPSDSEGGLQIYRSHFKETLAGQPATVNNGSVVGACGANQACTLAGGTESGGDVGGAIQGPFPLAGGTVHLTHSASPANNVTLPVPALIPTVTTGATYCQYTSPEVGNTLVVASGTDAGTYTIVSINAAGTAASVTPEPAHTLANVAYTWGTPVANWQPGVTCKHQ